MSLESLIKAGRFVDEEIHREYEKLGSSLEGVTPMSRYYAALGFNIAGGAFFSYHPISDIITGLDLGVSLIACMGMLKTQDNGSEIKVDIPIFDLMWNTNKVARAPLFLAGIGFAGYAVYEIGKGVINNESIPADAYTRLLQGLGMLSVSTSMYLKDKDPKLLEKDPAWKTAYKWAKEALAPKPLPEPSRIQAYQAPILMTNMGDN